MSTNRRNVAKITVMLCIAALTAFASIAQANGEGWEGEHCGKQQGHSFKKFSKKLGLSAAQKAQAKEIFQGNKVVVEPIITNLRAERKNLRALIHADVVDEAAIRAETVKVAAVQADLNVNRAKVGTQFRAILTPAQQETLKTMHQKRVNKTDRTIDPTE